MFNNRTVVVSLLLLFSAHAADIHSYTRVHNDNYNGAKHAFLRYFQHENYINKNILFSCSPSLSLSSTFRTVFPMCVYKTKSTRL